MPPTTIYLPRDLYEKVKRSPSKIIQKALREFFKKDSKSDNNGNLKNKDTERAGF